MTRDKAPQLLTSEPDASRSAVHGAGDSDTVQPNPWEALRRFTNARIALSRAGSSLPTSPLLAFNLAHAQARDAVHQPLDVSALEADLVRAGFETLQVKSAAHDRAEYLRRPDLGRRLADGCAQAISDSSGATSASQRSAAEPMTEVDRAEGACGDSEGETDPWQWDVVFVAADGLSASAVARHTVPLLEMLKPRMPEWRIGPVVIATQARVALGDGVGEALRARVVVVLIGERPGLSSPDSLGVYITYHPRVGTSDAQRNCISNVRPEGLPYAAAAFKLHYLLQQARQLGLTGVQLKDDSDALLAQIETPPEGGKRQIE